MIADHLWTRSYMDGDEHTQAHPIVQMTATRVRVDIGYGRTAWFDRAELEHTGSVWHKPTGRRYYTTSACAA